jgi:hypothetical protein
MWSSNGGFGLIGHEMPENDNAHAIRRNNRELGDEALGE